MDSLNLKAFRVADYMSRRLITLTPNMSVDEAIRLLLEHSISGAPVLESDQLIGVFSESDCLKGAVQASYHEMGIGTVAEYMTTDVQTIEASSSVLEAADAFLRDRRRRLPVMEDGKLVGQISRRDILRAINDFAAKH